MDRVQVLIVGAGPAGLSAGIEAAKSGAGVLMIDENRKPGGQLFKQIHKFFGSRAHRAGVRGFEIGRQLLAESQSLGVQVLLGYPVYGIFEGNRVLYGSPEGVKSICADRIILATGANENNICFEGSTLPGVMTAGAAQTMVNENRVLPGKRVVMIGAGNVGLIISYQIMQAGGQVAAIVEAGPTIGGYGVHAGKIRRAGVPILLSHTVNRVLGTEQVEGVELIALDEHFEKIPGTEQLIEADTVCMAVGLSPMVELAALAGCRLTESPALGGTVPLHNENMQTTVSTVYVAGDIAGVEEASTAIEEGRLAGIAAAESLGLCSDAQARKKAVHDRLAALRSGEFGRKRFEAKAAIEAAFQGGEGA
ncbi:MAG: NAD(P)/FAD-dependent oxidoreductase [Oscillospiraceae bacterium]